MRREPPSPGTWKVCKTWLSRADLLAGEPTIWFCRRQDEVTTCGETHRSAVEAARHTAKLNFLDLESRKASQ